MKLEKTNGLNYLILNNQELENIVEALDGLCEIVKQTLKEDHDDKEYFETQYKILTQMYQDAKGER